MISFFAGATTVLAFSPFDLFLIPLLTIAVLFYQWHKASSSQAAWNGYFFGLGLMGFGVFWLHISIAKFGGVILPVAMILAILFAAFIALFYALAAWLSVKFCQRFNCNITVKLLLVFPLFWVASELTRAYLWSGFPWLSIGYSQIDSPLIALAPVLGVFGVSWILVLFASLLLLLVIGERLHRVMVISVLIILGVLLSWLSSVRWVEPVDEKMTVRMIQLNIAQEVKWQPNYLESTIDQYVEQTFEKSADLIIWPETAVPAFSYAVEDSLLAPLLRRLQTEPMELVLGIPIKSEDYGYFNGMLSLGSQREEYHKRHLVPFGEFAPLDFLLRPLIDYFRIPMSDFRQGEADAPILKIGQHKVGVSICYEDVFGNETAQALPQSSYLINISNDAWFGDSLAPHQHLQIARMRAVENGRYLLRATNTGISAIINESGKVKVSSVYGEKSVIEGEFQPMQGETIYSKKADALILLILVGGLLLAGLVGFRRH